MALRLQVDEPLNATEQLVKDGQGAASVLALSRDSVGVGTTSPGALLGVGGDVHIERNGSPRVAIRSRGNGTQHYSIRVTNDQDSAGGRRFVIRNEDNDRDDLVLDNGGTISLKGDLHLERGGSPKIAVRSRGNGTQHYSIRATNDQDPAGGRLFVVRNEDQGRDELILDSRGNLTVAGDILLTGADCAERFVAKAHDDLEPGAVLVVGGAEELQLCTEPYDRRVAGVVSGAGDCRAGIVLGVAPTTADRVPVALAGKVYCKADATFSSIEVGDLLTTSTSTGHAMKATDRRRSFGAILGKALSPLTRGRDLIPVLVALH
jgi:hypothetical protein